MEYNSKNIDFNEQDFICTYIVIHKNYSMFNNLFW